LAIVRNRVSTPTTTSTTDPLSQLIGLLRPRTVFSKGISGAGRWGVRYPAFGQPSFCAVLEGGCLLALQGPGGGGKTARPGAAVALQAGDFVLLPATPGFTMTSAEPPPARELVRMDAQASASTSPRSSPQGELRHGRRGGRPDVRLLGGYFAFDSPDAALLVAMLPPLLHVRGVERLATLVRLVADEAGQRRAGRDLVLARLVELLLVEALRALPGDEAPPGLLRGLADERLALALRALHADPARPWTVEQLAKKAALSRSSFFERFTRAVGQPPMEYLLAWRMAMAKELLRGREGKLSVGQVAERVGYGSGSTFSTAFRRWVGAAPRGLTRVSG
jgi:AraC-like DNA-binding protein